MACFDGCVLDGVRYWHPDENDKPPIIGVDQKVRVKLIDGSIMIYEVTSIDCVTHQVILYPVGLEETE